MRVVRPPPGSLRSPPSPQGGGMKGVPPAPIPPPCGEGPERSEGGGGRATVARARSLRGAMTRYEVKLWLRLRTLKAQGFRFRRQAPIGRWIADFACFTNRIIVEVDGMQHGFAAELARDAVRDAFLSEQGFRVLRFTNGDIWENIDGVVEQIFAHRLMVAAVKSDAESVALPPPSSLCSPPSPQGRGMKGAASAPIREVKGTP